MLKVSAFSFGCRGAFSAPGIYILVGLFRKIKAVGFLILSVPSSIIYIRAK